MKRLLIIIVLSITLLFSCTKPLDNIVILKVKDKNTSMATDSTSAPTLTTVVTTAPDVSSSTTAATGERILIINKSSKKIHFSSECSYAEKILEENRSSAPFADLPSYLQDGYEICSYCEKHY